MILNLRFILFSAPNTDASPVPTGASPPVGFDRHPSVGESRPSGEQEVVVGGQVATGGSKVIAEAAKPAAEGLGGEFLSQNVKGSKAKEIVI